MNWETEKEEEFDVNFNQLIICIEIFKKVFIYFCCMNMCACLYDDQLGRLWCL